MNIASDFVRRGLWIAAFVVAFLVFLIVTMAANSAKSDVHRLERSIVATQRQKLLLETELQARANQRQLATWNALEFGYSAPRSDQFVDRPTDLAALSDERPSGAPQPIRVVTANARSSDSRLAELVEAVAELPIEETRISVNKAVTLFSASPSRDRIGSVAVRESSARWDAAPLAGRLNAGVATSSVVE